MGNAKQINKELIEKSKAEFLPAEFQDPEGSVEIYSLETEYASTRKNRNYILYVAVSLFLIAVVVLSVLWTSYISNQGKSLVVDISDFDDVQVLEMITETKQIEAEIARLKHELIVLKDDLNDKLSLYYKEFSSQKDAAFATESDEETSGDAPEGVAEAEVAEASTEVEADVIVDEEQDFSKVQGSYNYKVAVAKKQYSNKVEEINKKIDELEKRLVELKDEIGNKGQVAATALGGKDELYNLQMEKLDNQYQTKIDKLNKEHEAEINSLILKFNPNYSESQLKDLIAQKIKNYYLPSTLLKGVEGDLQSAKIANMNKITKIRNDITNQVLLLNRMEKVPYQNSIPRSLLHAEAMSKSAIKSYDAIVLQLVQELREKNKVISHYNYALNSKIKSDGENGFVLDTSNSKKIAVYLDKTYTLKNGNEAFIFRNEVEQVAKVKLFKEKGRYYASPVNVSPGMTIQPFDKIMFKVTKE